MNSTWYETAKRLLETRPHNLTLAKIAEETGLTESWLRAFSKGSINNPGVKQIETLTNYLLK